MLETTSFHYIEQIARQGVSNSFSILGVNFPFTVNTRYLSTPVTISSVFTRWYYGHMAEVNIELCALYWKSLVTPKDPYMLRIKKLNEFIPFTIKFSGIFNPFLQTEVWQNARRYPLFEGMFKSNTLCACTGRRLSQGFAEELSYAMFTNRGILSKLFGFNVAPAQGKEQDWYDPCFFGYVLWNQILTAINAPFSINGANKAWIAFIYDNGGISQIAEITCDPMPHLLDIQLETLRLNFESACIWMYLLATHPEMDSEWYTNSIPARRSLVAPGLSVQNLILTEIGGEFLGKSQTLTSYRDNQV